MTKSLEELEQLLCLLEKHNVVEYSDDDLKLTIKPKIVLPPVDAKDLAKTNKTKEQEEEELLFYSASR